ncbi:MAG: bifunctional enoyl-CoA hydratase/phosphate acetyltransferase [Solirubrobacterales bacterium]|nr:bifunctional enoyl-CoA hydratase/phosphate acetyltransferase [Solirubrobacterales bacterium]MBV9915805.1 bifunctional enoyl-CoA hydratase/phosphate acetyltransferase [Solirubrobacterales bacterium]
MSSARVSERLSRGPSPVDGDARAAAPTFVENKTFDEIELGESATLTRTLSRKDIDLFAVMSGDVNPAHVDDEFARSDVFHKIIAHGMWGGSLISTLLGTKLPGPGTIYLEQTLQFRRPVALGDTITVSVTARSKDAQRKRISLDCLCRNQRDEVVIEGSATVLAPTQKVRRPRAVLPEVQMHERGVLLHALIERARPLEPIRAAVVHPVDRDPLLGSVDAYQEGLIVPTLVGPERRIRACAEAEGIDISGFRIVATEHSHAAAAAAVQLVRAGELDGLIKGSLHTDELMHAVLAPEAGLRTDRRMSHVFVIEVPTQSRPLLISDAALNVQPDLAAKRDIVQNAIELAQAIGIELPKVAILSAIETVSAKLRSTLDAAALAKMAQRGQITGGIVDGPLAFDDAVSSAAAREKRIASPVAGQADVLIVPDLESGNIVVKQLDFLGGAQGAGVVLGARAPIALTGRAYTPLERVASCALAALIARRAATAPGMGKPPSDRSVS